MADKIKGGYILQARKTDDSPVMKMPPATRELFSYLCRKVNWKDSPVCKRGEGFFRLATIRDDLSWTVGFRTEAYSVPQLTKALRRLREGNMIVSTKETRGIRVKVLNYSFYNDPSNYEGIDEENMKEQRRIFTGHTILEEGNKEEIEEEGVMLIFPCSGKQKKWNLTQQKIDEWTEAYPTVDILAECKKALVWVKANNLKTARGMTRFLNGWISRSVDRGTAARIGSPEAPKPQQPQKRTQWQIKTQLDEVVERLTKLKSKSPGPNCELWNFLTEGERAEYNELIKKRDALKAELRNF